ncbi:MAG TPA: Calx-beta domain-containing protein [Thermoanaerobaculia bacterium]|nr:Calx-beta domain-containing protein [Thermoanaerobaculia bacterium]
MALAAVPASAATFTVINLNDSGAGSLRDAITQANGAAGADVINFQPGLTGTITLTTGQLKIADSVDIQGPGAATISVSGNNASRVFYLYTGSATLDVRIAGLTITQGAANIGAGIVDFDENLTLEGVTITQNAATGDGGGLWADGFSMTLTVNNSTISGNTSGDDGGGIYVEDTGGPMTFTNSVISGNQAVGAGGGIYFYDPDDDITFQNTTISGNTAGTIGGGIYLYSFDNGGMTFRGSTISGNSAQEGGGLFLYSIDTTPLLIENSTISGNHATAGQGGGIFLYNVSAGGTLSFATIASNTATGNGGGVFVESGTVTINDSIVADNTASANNDLDGTFDASYSLIETPGSAAINDIAGNIFSTDPNLGPLANNGGSTQTHMPGEGSPVINAGDPAFVPPPSTDQRALARVVGGRVDMGSVESNGGTIQFLQATYSVAETGGMLTVTLTRGGGTDPASVNYATSNGSAIAPGDYAAASGLASFAAGETTTTFNVAINDDLIFEGNQTFNLILSSPSANAALGAQSTAVATITDNEAPPTLAINSVSQAEGNSGTTPFNFTVTLTGASEVTATVQYATADGTAAAPGDYAATSGTLTFAPGVTTQPITVLVNGDTAFEPNETFAVNLNTPANATIATGSGTGTILNDDAGTVDLGITKTATGGAFFAGQPMTYTIAVNNAGPNAANAVAVTDILPAGATFVSAIPSQGTCSGTTTITCSLGVIANGSNATIALKITPNTPGPLSNTTTVSAAPQPDPNPANDSATSSVTVQPASAIPLFGDFTKILFAITSAIVGLYMMKKNQGE